MFRRTKRASTARLDHVRGRPVVAAPVPNAPDSRLRRVPRPAFRVAPSRPRWRLPSGRCSSAPGPSAPRRDSRSIRHFASRPCPKKIDRGQERQRVDPQPALGKEGAAELDPGDRPRLTRASRRTRIAAGHATRLQSGTRYRASTFSSAGTTPSMRWPSSAIRPSARANCSRSRVITSRPMRSSFNLISVT